VKALRTFKMPLWTRELVAELMIALIVSLALDGGVEEAQRHSANVVEKAEFDLVVLMLVLPEIH
jgi:hypothetical protein